MMEQAVEAELAAKGVGPYGLRNIAMDLALYGWSGDDIQNLLDAADYIEAHP